MELDDEDVPVRNDYCASCVPQDTDSVLYWETRWVAVTERKKKLDFHRLLRLFEVWLEKPPEGIEPLLYLIALLLIRKRFFRMLDLVSEGGDEYLRLRRPGPEQVPFLVPAPLLTKEQLPQLRVQLEELLDGALEEDEVEEAATS